MQLLDWTPVVSRPTTNTLPASDNHRARKNDPVVSVHALLQCLFCGTATSLITKPSRMERDPLSTLVMADKIPESERWKHNCHSTYTQLKKERTCEECGLVSAMPAKQAENLLVDMQKTMNAQWATEQALKDLPPYIAIMEGLVDMKGQIAEQVAVAMATHFGNQKAELIAIGSAQKASKNNSAT